MHAIGLDIGTTSLCAVVLDVATGRVVETVTQENDSALPAAHAWERMQDPARILSAAEALVERLIRTHAPVAAIGVTGQMHGIVYLNKAGDAVSPLYTWQDGRGGLPYRDGQSYADYLTKVTGYQVASGYGMATHLYNAEQGLVPQDAVCLCTIHDYVAMRLAGRPAPVLHPSDAASLGLYDAQAGAFDGAALAKVGLDPALLPAVSPDAVVLGKTSEGIPVASAVGDNQASFAGAVRGGERSVLVNVGTGSQVSLLSDSPHTAPGVEARPYENGTYLLVGSSLCGGRAYAALADFYNELIAAATGAPCERIYDVMASLAERATGEPLTVLTTFDGTREDPALRGSVTGIGLSNFTPGHLTAGVLDGMVAELYGLYMAMAQDKRPTQLVGSGNGIRKNPLLAQRFAAAFQLPLSIPVHTEEAAFGAALFGLTAAGVFPDLSAAQLLIRYEEEQ